VKLFESRAIARYIDAKSGGKLLHLANVPQYGLVETWASVEASNFDKYAYALVVELIFKKEADKDEVARLKTGLFKVLDVYNAQLETKKYIAGDSLSIADLFHLPNFAYLVPKVPELLQNRPHLTRWWDALSALPAWKATLAEK